ncbi:hypothetical protein KSW89_02915 [Prevotella copri]|uniref:Phosphoribosyltransferase domain-containing protein n=2 Tax=Segatella copri TaxID=165179 RepID=A0AAW4NCD2_9BACT|nr:hypothetical protein [Segatella copri]MBU9910000.1 hypothetical protein [Segatella copri]MBV3407290.1 hypothetical protein [Segatella copri]MBV3418683.1 hypothetical protein [Segatella copri]MBV3440048.1 hypothetical protein [Segatella copri]MBV3458507.1 hypothetical protein [Segatella copri]
MPEGTSWGGQFPPVVNHTTSAVARHHPDFKAAKHGDFQAALRLVDELVKDEKIAMIARQFPNAHIIYNHKIQGDGINMIPAAYAVRFSAIGMTVEHDIIAVTDVSHTNASDISRISKRMRFEGHVNRGTDYILLDDFITSGAELRDLRDYVNSQGGNVVAMTTFGHGSFGKLKDVRIDEAYKQKLGDAGVTDNDLRKYGIASEIGCLTLGEAAKLTRMVNSKAKGKTSQVYGRLQRIADTCGNAQAVDEKLSGDNTKEELINNNNDNNSAVRKRLHR